MESAGKDAWHFPVKHTAARHFCYCASDSIALNKFVKKKKKKQQSNLVAKEISCNKMVRWSFAIFFGVSLHQILSIPLPLNSSDVKPSSTLRSSLLGWTTCGYLHSYTCQLWVLEGFEGGVTNQPETIYYIVRSFHHKVTSALHFGLSVPRGKMVLGLLNSRMKVIIICGSRDHYVRIASIYSTMWEQVWGCDVAIFRLKPFTCLLARTSESRIVQVVKTGKDGIWCICSKFCKQLFKHSVTSFFFLKKMELKINEKIVAESQEEKKIEHRVGWTTCYD